MWAGSTTSPVESPESPEGCNCLGRVGNVNCDYRDDVTLADVLMLIDHLFISGVRLPSPEEANANGDPQGEISLADVLTLVDHLFISGQELPECPRPYNTPPNTYMVRFREGVSYINAAARSIPTTGLPISWAALDLVDHPYDDPTFSFEYRIYGPYTDAEYTWIGGHLVREVFLTNDGQMLLRGQPPVLDIDSVWDGDEWLYDTTMLFTSFVVCDTTWLPGGVREISCDTVLIDSIEDESPYGRLDGLFDIEDPAFAPYDRVAASSGDGEQAWTTDLSDTAYNLFADYPNDTTVRANFYIWVRARDPLDPDVVDPAPVFRRVQVVDPKHERDVLVMDWAYMSAENGPKRVPHGPFWDTAVQHWIEHGVHDGSVEFQVAVDWRHYDSYQATQMTSKSTQILTDVLRHKVVIVVQDIPAGGAWSSQGQEVIEGLMPAMPTGVNVWVVARVPFGRPSLQSPFAQYTGSVNYQYFFGATQYTFPGWGSHLYTNPTGYGLPRTEDFIGALSEDTLRWPNLAVDTALLRTRYKWEGCVPSPECYLDVTCDPTGCVPFYPFIDDDFEFLGAIPQVGWAQPTTDAEVMYTFKSLYGPVHPIEARLSFEGLPVMHRVDRGLFRSVHSCFSPLAMEATGAYQLVDSILNWLYEPWLAEGSSRGGRSASEGRVQR